MQRQLHLPDADSRNPLGLSCFPNTATGAPMAAGSSVTPSPANSARRTALTGASNVAILVLTMLRGSVATDAAGRLRQMQDCGESTSDRWCPAPT